MIIQLGASTASIFLGPRTSTWKNPQPTPPSRGFQRIPLEEQLAPKNLVRLAATRDSEVPPSGGTSVEDPRPLAIRANGAVLPRADGDRLVPRADMGRMEAGIRCIEEAVMATEVEHCQKKSNTETKVRSHRQCPELGRSWVPLLPSRRLRGNLQTLTPRFQCCISRHGPRTIHLKLHLMVGCCCLARLREKIMLGRFTAVWVYGCMYTMPRALPGPLQLLIHHRCSTMALPPSTSPVLHEARLDSGDGMDIAGISITAPLRTAIDPARPVPALPGGRSRRQNACWPSPPGWWRRSRWLRGCLRGPWEVRAWRTATSCGPALPPRCPRGVPMTGWVPTQPAQSGPAGPLNAETLNGRCPHLMFGKYKYLSTGPTSVILVSARKKLVHFLFRTRGPLTSPS